MSLNENSLLRSFPHIGLQHSFLFFLILIAIVFTNFLFMPTPTPKFPGLAITRHKAINPNRNIMRSIGLALAWDAKSFNNSSFHAKLGLLTHLVCYTYDCQSAAMLWQPNERRLYLTNHQQSSFIFFN